MTRLGERFVDALGYAARLHAEQRRKGSHTPYVAHLLSVAALVIEHRGTEDEAIGALLHDAVEDQGGVATGEEIRERFGEAVYEIVSGCTDAVTLPKPPWAERKQVFVERLRAQASASVALVCTADKLHNARSILMDHAAIGEAVWSRFIGGRDGTLWYYRAIAEALGTHVRADPRLAPLHRQLAETVAALQSLQNPADPTNPPNPPNPTDPSNPSHPTDLP